MQLYEFTYLIHPKTKKESRESLEERVKSFIKDQEGKTTHIIPPSKKRLAYPIKNQEKAFLATFLFRAEPKKLAGIEENIKKEEDILRYLILKREEEKERKRRKKEAPETEKEKGKKPKVELKEIEKKLEEILGQ